MEFTKSIRILIADHDRGFAEATRRFLEPRGHEVVVVADGMSCVEELRAIAPSLLVLDPEILWGGGEGVLDMLIQEEPLAPLSVVILESSEARTIPESFHSRIDGRLQRPKGLNEMPRFVKQLEDIGTKATSLNRDLDMESRCVATHAT
jgi:CheY-like chemotaxis protein